MEVEESSRHKYKYLLISYTGVTAYPQRKSDMDMFGLYHKTEEMRDGRSVYIQEHDEQYGSSPCKLFRDQGVWWIKYHGDLRLRTATPSDSPTSVKWQYEDYDSKWHDLELTVTGLSEKPSECQITISLSPDVARIIKDSGVAGVYRALSSYCRGRRVLQHLGGCFILYVVLGCWNVIREVGGDISYLWSGSAPRQCPADPRVGRNEQPGPILTREHWGYYSKQQGHSRSRGISVKCNKHKL